MNAMKHAAGRYLQALVMGKGNPELAAAFAEGQGQWLDRPVVVAALKAAVAGTVSGDFSGARSTISDAFLEAMRGDSIPLRLAMRRVPMHTRIYANTSGVLASQIAQGAPIPVLKGTWTPTTLTPKKCAGLVVQTEELAKSTDPGAPLALVDDLAKAVAAEENRTFLSPTVTGSILDGAPNFASTGATVTGVDADLRALVDRVPAAFRAGTVFVMTMETAVYLGTLRDTTGAAAYPNIGPQGGVLLGLPVLITDACMEPGSPPTRIIALVAASEIYWAQGGVELLSSTQATLEMTDAPTGNSATGNAGTTSLVSMFQANAVATRAIRESAWYAKSGSTAWLTTSY
jgi:HK97 family phage major capsid protein